MQSLLNRPPPYSALLVKAVAVRQLIYNGTLLLGSGVFLPLSLCFLLRFKKANPPSLLLGVCMCGLLVKANEVLARVVAQYFYWPFLRLVAIAVREDTQLPTEERRTLSWGETVGLVGESRLLRKQGNGNQKEGSSK